MRSYHVALYKETSGGLVEELEGATWFPSGGDYAKTDESHHATC